MDNASPVTLLPRPSRLHPFLLRIACAAMAAVVALSLAACGARSAAPKAGQTLASVNGEEITALQLNEELQRANVQAAQQESASKQLLEALIDRQLLQNEAARDKTDRDPKVVQAIERAKALIIAQAYLQKKVGAITRPSADEIRDYYARHPDFFAKRKQFDMHQLVIDTKDLTEQVKSVADKAKALDEVAAWFDANNVRYLRTQASRTTSDLAPEMSARLASMDKGRLFVVREGQRSMLISIADIKDSPASLELASPQIEQFLLNKKSKEAAAAELQRLRATAKIDYLNKPAPVALNPATAGAAVAAAPAASAAAPAPTAVASAPPAASPGAPSDAVNARGVAGLK